METHDQFINMETQVWAPQFTLVSTNISKILTIRFELCIEISSGTEDRLLRFGLRPFLQKEKSQ